MMPPCSWSTPGRKPGTSTKVMIGRLKASQKRTKRPPLRDASMSSTPARCDGWFATMPTERPPKRAKPTTMFLPKSGCTSRKLPSSTTSLISSLMSYGLFGLSGTRLRSAGSCAIGGILGRDEGRVLEVVLRDEREQVADDLDALLFGVHREVRDAALGGVRDGAAELLRRDLFVRHRLDHVGTGDEHVRGVLHHDDEVGHRGRVDRAARARAHDRRDLRDHAGREHVAREDVAVAAERHDAFLDARAGAVVEADERRAGLGREVHHLADLLGEGAGERAAEDGEVLREQEDQPAVDLAVAGHDAVARDLLLFHPEVGAAVDDEAIGLDEGARVEQQLDALARA